MKTIKLALLIVLLLGAAGDAAAHGGGRVRFGVFVGPAWGAWGPWYPPPYYPPVIVREAAPPVYIERPAEPEPVAYWYYCNNSRAYYPYVRECPAGWLRVPAEPADQR